MVQSLHLLHGSNSDAKVATSSFGRFSIDTGVCCPIARWIAQMLKVGLKVGLIGLKVGLKD